MIKNAKGMENPIVNKNQGKIRSEKPK